MAKSEKAKKQKQRYRNWTFIYYPETYIDRWPDTDNDEFELADYSELSKWQAEYKLKGYWACHDSDIDAETGEVKKLHIHVVIMFDSVKSLEQVLELVSGLGVSYVEPVQSIGPMLRYLTHLDNPEKYQYSAEYVTPFGGAMPYAEAVDKTEDDGEYKVLRQVFAYIRENGIVSFARLADCLAIESNPQLFKVCVKHSYAVLGYLKSVAWEGENNG